MSDHELKLDQIADAFEEAWHHGVRPNVAEFLKKADSDWLTPLAELLIPLDVEYRIKVGETVSARDYRDLLDGGESIAERVLKLSEFKTANLDETRGSKSKPVTGGNQGDSRQRPDLGPTQSRPAPRSKSQTIGPYKLLQKLGAGGMGEVWVAEQTEPVKRQVALKLIKEGMGSQEIIARFAAERQALALMNHPNIARILDAGTTEQGQPFFVMELVAGKPLTTYCDNNKLSIEERLILFMDVCAGVQHAHQKGIIHRDLKPGNIIVGMTDGVAVPKVIDFGLAKAMESTQRLTDQSLFTGIGQILGTLKYMSPEQASLDNLDIDTRTDIYALGVILYELLAGSTPLDDSSIKGQAALKLLEFIRDKDPVKPSSKLESSTDERVSMITGQRQTDRFRLKRVLLGDLDWIVMKALEKNRSRRYESASGFAADVRRFLSNEPVIARPPSLNYRLRKFVRKNRVVVIATLFVLFALVSGLIGTGLGMREANFQAEIARQETREKEQARVEERRQREEADKQRHAALLAQRMAEEATTAERESRLEEARQRKFAQAINQFVKDDFLALTSFEGQERFGKDEAEGLNENSTLRDLLERAAAKLEARDDLDPLIEAELRYILGVNLRATENYQQAISMLELSVKLRQKELGSEHPDTLFSMGALAVAYSKAGRFDEALSLHKLTFELRRKILGSDHRTTLTSMANVADAYQTAGQLKQALLLHEQTLELRKAKFGPEHLDTLVSMNNLAAGYSAAGQLDKALPLYEATLQLMKAKLGPDHATTLLVMKNLARSYSVANQLDKALPLRKESLELLRDKLGASHSDTLWSMNSLAVGYSDAGQLDKALPLLEESLELTKATYGADDPRTLVCMGNLASGYYSTGQLDKALPLREESLELMRAKLGPSDPDTLWSMANLAAVYWKLKMLDRSIPLFEEALEQMAKKLGRNHPDTQATIANLGVNYKDAGRVDAAIPLLEEVFENSKRSGQLVWVKGPLRDAYIKGKRVEQFHALATVELVAARASLAEGSPELANVLVSLGKDHLTIGDAAQAEKLLSEGCQIRQLIAPDVWNTFNAQSLLGGALLARTRAGTNTAFNEETLAKAESLLIQGYEGMKQREPVMPSQAAESIPAALDRLVDLYESLHKPELVAKYRDLRAAYPSPPPTPARND